MSRRRVSLVESFKVAGKAADQSGGGDAGLLATIAFGFWWWIVGVPEDDSTQETESGDGGP